MSGELDDVYYLRLKGTKQILSKIPGQPLPRWWATEVHPDNVECERLPFASPDSAVSFLRGLAWTNPEFYRSDIQVVTIRPPTEETIMEETDVTTREYWPKGMTPERP